MCLFSSNLNIFRYAYDGIITESEQEHYEITKHGENETSRAQHKLDRNTEIAKYRDEADASEWGQPRNGVITLANARVNS